MFSLQPSLLRTIVDEYMREVETNTHQAAIVREARRLRRAGDSTHEPTIRVLDRARRAPEALASYP